MAPSRSRPPTRRSTASGCASRPARTSTSGAAASRCPISTCAAGASRSGPRSPASGATRPPKSPSSPMSTGKSGGDYYNTNYPQPTYVSSEHYALHVETTAYSVFDFRKPDFHEIEIWAVPERIELFAPPDLRRAGRGAVGAVRPPAAAARMGLWRCDHRPEGWRATRFDAARAHPSRPARRSRACGARTGSGCATPPSARACSGTGRPMRSAIPTCASASPS